MDIFCPHPGCLRRSVKVGGRARRMPQELTKLPEAF